MLALPEPILARSGPIPTGPGWRFELKLDAFRCLVCTRGGRLRVRNRRGWDMTKLVLELTELPPDVQLDGRQAGAGAETAAGVDAKTAASSVRERRPSFL